MQDNVPAYASKNSMNWLVKTDLKGDWIMMWLPSSSGNLSVNYLALTECEICQDGKQLTSQSGSWEFVLAASANIKRDQIKNLTGSMAKRLMMVIEQNSYTGH